MFCKYIASKWLFFSKTVKLFYCTQTFNIYDKHFEFFRNKTDYKNLVVQLTDDFHQTKIVSSDISKEQNVQTDKLFSHLLQRDYVMKLSPTQLKDILGLMANLKIDSTEYTSALKYLDEKCALSADRWSLDLSLYILDAWFIILGPKAFRKHYYSVVPNVWSRKMKKCSKYNLLLMLYFIGMSKTSPPFLMEILEDKMEGLIFEFTDEEWAIACLSFFKSSKPIISNVLLNHSCKVAENLLVKHDRFNLISILKCFRLSKHYNEELFFLLSEYIKKEYKTFNFVECTNFLAVFSSERFYKEEIFQCLETQGILMLATEDCSLSVTKTKLELKTHPSLRSRVKDIARFLWSMSSVGHILQRKSIKELNNLLNFRLSIGEFEINAHVLVDCLQSLILIENFNESLIAHVYKPSVISKIFSNEKSKPRYQLHFIHKSVQIECPSIDNNEKDPIFNSIPKNLNRDMEERMELKILFEFLKQNSTSSIKCGYIMPHIMIAGIIAGTDINACETPFFSGQNEINQCNFLKTFIDKRVLSKHAFDMFRENKFYTCIEILDKKVCIQGTSEPLGLMKTKIRQLQKLGFHVVALTPNEINVLILEKKIASFPDLSHMLK